MAKLFSQKAIELSTLLGIQRKGILRSVVHSSIKQYIGKNEIHTLYVIIIKTKKYAYV
jgi:hypothetical protein